MEQTRDTPYVFYHQTGDTQPITAVKLSTPTSTTQVITLTLTEIMLQVKFSATV